MVQERRLEKSIDSKNGVNCDPQIACGLVKCERLESNSAVQTRVSKDNNCLPLPAITLSSNAISYKNKECKSKAEGTLRSIIAESSGASWKVANIDGAIAATHGVFCFPADRQVDPQINLDLQQISMSQQGVDSPPRDSSTRDAASNNGNDSGTSTYDNVQSAITYNDVQGANTYNDVQGTSTYSDVQRISTSDRHSQNIATAKDFHTISAAEFAILATGLPTKEESPDNTSGQKTRGPICDPRNEKTSDSDVSRQRTQEIIRQAAESPATGAIVHLDSSDTYREIKPAMDAPKGDQVQAGISFLSKIDAVEIKPEPRTVRQELTNATNDSVAPDQPTVRNESLTNSSNESSRRGPICPPKTGTDNQANGDTSRGQTIIKEAAESPAAGAKVNCETDSDRRSFQAQANSAIPKGDAPSLPEINGMVKDQQKGTVQDLSKGMFQEIPKGTSQDSSKTILSSDYKSTEKHLSPTTADSALLENSARAKSFQNPDPSNFRIHDSYGGAKPLDASSSGTKQAANANVSVAVSDADKQRSIIEMNVQLSNSKPVVSSCDLTDSKDASPSKGILAEKISSNMMQSHACELKATADFRLEKSNYIQSEGQLLRQTNNFPSHLISSIELQYRLTKQSPEVSTQINFAKGTVQEQDSCTNLELRHRNFQLQAADIPKSTEQKATTIIAPSFVPALYRETAASNLLPAVSLRTLVTVHAFSEPANTKISSEQSSVTGVRTLNSTLLSDIGNTKSQTQLSSVKIVNCSAQIIPTSRSWSENAGGVRSISIPQHAVSFSPMPVGRTSELASGRMATAAVLQEQKTMPERTNGLLNKSFRPPAESRQLPGIEIVIGALLSTTAIAKAKRGLNDAELFAVELQGSGGQKGLQQWEPIPNKADANQQSRYAKQDILMTALEVFNKKLGFGVNCEKTTKDALYLKNPPQQESKQKPSNKQSRQKYVIKGGDSLEVLAEALYYDRSVAWLIADLNRHKIKECVVKDQRVIEICVGQVIELPQSEEVELFLKERAAKFKETQKIVTLLSDPTDHADMMQEILGSVMI